ncbi:FEKKY domain-containing protein [Flavobacterium microcysteis]
MKKYIYIIVLLISSLVFGQAQNEIGCTKYLAISAKTNFENDLKNNTITIYLQGGIVSVIKNEDLVFQKKYGINYHDSGCVASKDFEYYRMYNHHVFAYLSRKFGEDWKKELNTNAFGIT